MKKRFSYVLAIIMVVCTLSIALVACAPKDEDPFKAPTKYDAYTEIWNSWVRANGYQGGDTLGIDLKVDAKNTKDSTITDLSIILQVGLDGKSGSDKEAIRLAVIDNNKKDDIIDIVVNKDGLYFDALGMEKPLLFNELNLPALGVDPEGANDVIEQAKGIIVDVVMALIGTDVTVDPVKNGKTFDVIYTFGLNFESIVSLLEELELPALGLDASLVETIGPIVDQIVPVVKDLLDGLKVDFTVKTTGNEQIKVENPAKGAPKYNYKGGKAVSFAVTGSKGENALNIAINGLALNNTLPTVSAPAESEVVKASLLKHRITGNITKRDAKGDSVGDYTYEINVDFSAENILSAIAECVNTGNANPLIKHLLTSQDGKIFIEVNHTCGTTCKTTHVGGKKMDGSIIAIAYSPEHFDNNRIYVSLDLQTIVNNSFMEDVIGIDLNSLFPSYYTQFSFDVVQYLELIDMRANGVKPDAAKANIGTIADGEEEPAFDISAMLLKIIAGLQNDKELQIEIEDIRGILDMLLEKKKLDEGVHEKLLTAINSLFDGVDTLAIDAVYENGKSFEGDILELYKRQNDTTQKTFYDADKPNENANHKIIKGGLTGIDKDAAGNVKIYQGNSNNLNEVIYDANGAYKTMSYGELMELVVDRDATGNKNTVVVRFNDIYGEAVESRMNIIEIVGLDPKKFGKPQDVALVLSTGNAANRSAGIGSNINNLIGVLKEFSSSVKDLEVFNEITTPELVVKTQITISEVVKVEWDQTKVTGIKEDQIFDDKKVYANGDALSDMNHLKITFANGEVHETDVKAGNTKDFIDSSKKVTSWGTFTMNFTAFGESISINVKMNDELGVDNQTVSLLLNNEGKVIYKISSSIKNNAINANMSLEEGATMASIGEFADANGFAYEATTGFLDIWNGCNITFNKKGTYKLTLKGENNAVINFTFIVTENNAE